MESEVNTLVMATSIRESMLMGCRKDSVSTSGLMAASIKATSSKDSEVGMACGMPAIPNLVNPTKVITPWTKSQTMECTNGRTDGYTKATSRMTIVMAMASSLRAKNVCTEAIG